MWDTRGREQNVWHGLLRRCCTARAYANHAQEQQDRRGYGGGGSKTASAAAAAAAYIIRTSAEKGGLFFFFISFFLLFRIHAHTSREKRIKNVIYRIVTCVCFVYTHTIGRDTLTRAYRISRRRVYTVGVQTRLYRSTEGEGEIIKKNFFFIYVKRKRGKKHAESAIFANFFFFCFFFLRRIRRIPL